MLNVLYLHHCPVFGGASKSLYEAISALPENEVQPTFILPRGGNVIEIFRKLGCPIIPTLGVSQFDNTYYGYYRQHRWIILLREMFFLPFTFLSILKARRCGTKFDVIHINEITQLPGIIFCRMLFPQTTIVVHIRSLLNIKSRWRTRLINFLIEKCANKYISIDKSVDQTVSLKIPGEIVHNGFKVRANNATPAGRGKNVKIAFIANLLPSKGIYDFLEASKISLERNDNIELYIMGNSPRSPGTIVKPILSLLGFYKDTRDDVLRFIHDNGFDERIKFLGFVSDIEPVLKDIDVVCFPSHLNALGRPIFEAAFFRRPSIVTSKDMLPDDVFIDNVSGIRTVEKNPLKLADAFSYVDKNRKHLEMMGDGAYEIAQRNFNIVKNASRLLQIYQGKRE